LHLPANKGVLKQDLEKKDGKPCETGSSAGAFGKNNKRPSMVVSPCLQFRKASRWHGSSSSVVIRVESISLISLREQQLINVMQGM